MLFPRDSLKTKKLAMVASFFVCFLELSAEFLYNTISQKLLPLVRRSQKRIFLIYDYVRFRKILFRDLLGKRESIFWKRYNYPRGRHWTRTSDLHNVNVTL